MISKEKLIEWGITMHNHVNKSNGKKVYTYEEGMKEIYIEFPEGYHEEITKKELLSIKKKG
jgi:hypothetical protein